MPGTSLLAPSANTSLVHPHPWLDRGLYPFRHRFIEVEGHELHYIDEGAGSPVLFVHGTPSWSFEWRAQVSALSGSHRAIALDHLGFGLSNKPPEASYRPVDHARRLLEMVRSLELEDVTLVVHDFGGPIGLWVALEEPWRFRSIVAMNTWMWGAGDDPRVARISRFVASPIGRFLYLWLNASPRWLLPATFADRRRLSPIVHRHYTRPFGRRRERTGPWVLGCELNASDEFFESLWERREELPCEPAFVWGMSDPAAGSAQLARFLEAWPDARVTEIEDAGHFPQEEAPERVTAAIAEAASVRSA